jgi:hypothetical protein
METGRTAVISRAGWTRFPADTMFTPLTPGGADHTKLIAKSIPGAELAFLPGDHFVAGKIRKHSTRKFWNFWGRTD